MELISNLFQFAVTLLGFCMSGIRYLKGRKQTYFLLTCFYGCFALGSLYWTLYLLLFSETPQVFYVSEFGWGSQRDFPLSSAIHPFLCGGKRLFDTEISDSSSDRRSALCILLYFWGCSLQSALVWHDDRCFLSFYPGSCLCADTDGNSV